MVVRSCLVSSHGHPSEVDDAETGIQFPGHVGDELVKDPAQLVRRLQSLDGQEVCNQDAEGVGA